MFDLVFVLSNLAIFGLLMSIFFVGSFLEKIGKEELMDVYQVIVWILFFAIIIFSSMHMEDRIGNLFSR